MCTTVLRLLRQPQGPRRLLLRAHLRRHLRQHHRRDSHSQREHLRLRDPCHRPRNRDGHPRVHNRADWIGSVDNLGRAVGVTCVFHALATCFSVRIIGGDNSGILGKVGGFNITSSQFTQIGRKLIKLIKIIELIYHLVIVGLFEVKRDQCVPQIGT